MNKTKALGILSAAVIAATTIAGLFGHGPMAAEIKAAVCGEAVK